MGIDAEPYMPFLEAEAIIRGAVASYQFQLVITRSQVVSTQSQVVITHFEVAITRLHCPTTRFACLIGAPSRVSASIFGRVPTPRVHRCRDAGPMMLDTTIRSVTRPEHLMSNPSGPDGRVAQHPVRGRHEDLHLLTQVETWIGRAAGTPAATYEFVDRARRAAHQQLRLPRSIHSAIHAHLAEPALADSRVRSAGDHVQEAHVLEPLPLLLLRARLAPRRPAVVGE